MKINAFTKEDLLIFKRAYKYFKDFRMKLFLIFILILSSIIFGLLYPYLWGEIISVLSSGTNSKIIFLYLGIMTVSQIIEFLFGYFQSIMYSHINSNLISNFRMDMYGKILNLPMIIFEKTKTGEIINRMNNDVDIIVNTVTKTLIDIAVNFLKATVIGFVMFKINVILGIIVLISMLINYFDFVYFGQIIRKKDLEIKKIYDLFYSKVIQSIIGIKEIKSLGLKVAIFDINKRNFEAIRDESIKISLVSINSRSISKFVDIMFRCIQFFVGIYLIYDKRLELGLFIAFTSYSQQFVISGNFIMNLNTSLQHCIISLRRIFELIDNFNQRDDDYGEIAPPQLFGEITFNNVCFEYETNNRVLNSVSFTIKKNCINAIVGKSGSGKTTIFSLILRLYKQVEGNIYLDNYDIKYLSENYLNQNVSIVSQRPYFFNMSIVENFRLINKDVKMEEIQEACKKAFIHDFIMQLPQKYDSVIGESSNNLSCGQVQRLAIARALVKKSKIILLDEATASLDNESQLYIKKAIVKIAKEHTVVVIAHRLSTILDAENIIVMDEGNVVATGSHKILMRKSEVYNKLFQSEWGLVDEYVENRSLV